jgi:competence protein ComEC
VDFRLVAPALAVWSATWAGLLSGWVVAAVLAGLSWTAAVPLWLFARWRPWGNIALAALMIGGVAAAGVALRLYQVERNPLRAVAAEGGQAVVQVVLEENPQPIKRGSFGGRRPGDRSLVRATLLAMETSGHRTTVGGEVLLLTPTQPWRPLIAGQEVTASGRVIPPRRSELTVALLQVLQPPHDVRPAPRWERAAENLRAGLRATSAAVLGPTAAALLPGLVTGDVSGLPAEVIHDFHSSGLIHLVAVSGSNLAIVCGAVLLVLRAVGAGPVLSATGAGLALLGFIVLTGPEPSVLRAAGMGGIALLALLLGRQRDALPALAGSALLLVLISPPLALSPGFALSVLATAGLILLAPVWCAALCRRGVPPGWAEALAVSAAAHVVTAPLIAALSGEISIVAVVANLLAEPVIAPATVLGVLATVTSPMSAGFARFLVWLAGPELEWVLAVAHRAAEVPGAVVEWPSGAVGGLSLAVVTVIALIAARYKRLRWAMVTIAVVAVAVLVPVRVLAPGWPVQGWTMVACDVGQGDALVLATGEPGEAVVVDTGPDPTLTSGCLRRLGIRRVPLIVLTHLHADHIGGLSAVLADHQVGAVAVGALREPAWASADVARDARARHVPLIPLSAGQRTGWRGLVLDVLGPVDDLATSQSATDANDASVVLRATTAAGRILLAGDIGIPGQARLLAARADLRADVLKIPHHGSRYTTQRFVDTVHPKLALISVGAGNSYGHPSPQAIDLAARTGATVLRTDQEGDIAIVPSDQGPRAVARGSPVRAGR